VSAAEPKKSTPDKQWQRPDWRDPSKYPDPKKATVHQWQWEFLRRHKDYEADYAKYDALWESDDNWTGVEELRPFYEKYGIKYMPAPWQEYQDQGTSDVRENLQFLRPFQYQVFEKGKIYASHLYPGVNLFSGKPAPEPLLRLEREGEVMIKLHLSTPITQQMESIKELLTELQKPFVEKGILKLDKRIRPDQYPDYLRILDGKHAECSNREIAAVLYNSGIELPYPNHKLERKLRDQLEAAEDLATGSYRNLHLYPGKSTKSPSTLVRKKTAKTKRAQAKGRK